MWRLSIAVARTWYVRGLGGAAARKQKDTSRHSDPVRVKNYAGWYEICAPCALLIYPPEGDGAALGRTFVGVRQHGSGQHLSGIRGLSIEDNANPRIFISMSDRISELASHHRCCDDGSAATV